MTKENIAEESVTVLSNSGSVRRSLAAGDTMSVKVGTYDADTSAGSKQYGSAGLLSVFLGAAGAALLLV